MYSRSRIFNLGRLSTPGFLGEPHNGELPPRRTIHGSFPVPRRSSLSTDIDASMMTDIDAKNPRLYFFSGCTAGAR